MKDKKQILIVSALAVVMLGVGAFQFMGGSAPAPAPAADTKATKKHTEAVTASETTPKTTVSSTEPNAATGEGQTPITTDPNAPPSTDPKATTDPAEGALEMSVDPLLVAAAKLSPRDPFNGSSWDMETPILTKVAPPQPRPYTPRPATTYRPKPRGTGLGSGVNPWPVGPDNVNLPEVQGGGTNPSAIGGANGMPSIDDVPYKVNGVINGRQPAVVVSDTGGAQRLVKVGSKLDPDTEVIGIQRGKMVVRKNGKVKTISIEEAAPAKAGGNSPEKK